MLLLVAAAATSGAAAALLLLLPLLLPPFPATAARLVAAQPSSLPLFDEMRITGVWALSGLFMSRRGPRSSSTVPGPGHSELAIGAVEEATSEPGVHERSVGFQDRGT